MVECGAKSESGNNKEEEREGGRSEGERGTLTFPRSLSRVSIVPESVNCMVLEEMFLDSRPVSYTHLTLPTNREV